MKRKKKQISKGIFLATLNTGHRQTAVQTADINGTGKILCTDNLQLPRQNNR